MKKICVLLFLCGHFFTEIQAQVDEDPFPDFTKIARTNITPQPTNEQIYEGVHLINAASKVFCAKDTLQAIKLLEEYILKFPKAGARRATKCKIATLHLEIGNWETAKNIFEEVLKLPQDELVFGEHYEHCPIIVKGDLRNLTLFRACLNLSKIAILKSKFEEAKMYLSLAEKDYFPQTDCGNGYYLYMCEWIPYSAEYHLVMKDTSAAFKVYLTGFFNYEGSYSPRFIKEIRQVIRLKFSEKEIKNEIKNCLFR
jgi:tetratricopeptide (TPR) repeat protein